MTWELVATIGVAIYVVPVAVVGFYCVVRSFLMAPVFPPLSLDLPSDPRYKPKMRLMVIGILLLATVDLALRAWDYFFRV